MEKGVNFDRFNPEDLGKNILAKRKSGKKNFVTILFGSGCSKSAGIPLASEIVEELRSEKLKNAGDAPEGISEYAFLMEKLGSPMERAEYLKELIGRSEKNGERRINWSHLLLAAMVKDGYINRILTTNFDPLIVDALAVMGQPIRTYDLNTAGKYHMGILDPSTVVYLHGQMHSLLLANITTDMENLGSLYPPVLQESVHESFLVVVGYSGDCDPVLNAITELRTLPRGLWWSHYGEGLPGNGVQGLFRKHGADCHLSIGDDADTFMRKLVIDGLGLDLPEQILNPIDTAKITLGRITPFPSEGLPEADPVKASLEVLERLQELLVKPSEEPVDRDDRTGSTREEEKPTSLGGLNNVVQLEMAALVGDWDRFDKIREGISRNPREVTSHAIGSGLLIRASNSILNNQFEIAFDWLREAEAYGLPSEDAAWLPTTLGIALGKQALMKGDSLETDVLFAEAGRKYAEALRIKPDMHEAFSNWGITLSNQAKLKGDSPEADALFAEAGRKYAEAIRIKPDMHEAFSNWGNALLNQAKLKGDSPEADALFAEAGHKYVEAIRIKPDKHETFLNWGNALLGQARLKGDSPEADALLAEAGHKYAEAVRIKPDMHEAFYNWGNALSSQIKLKGNSPEADTLLAEAGHKYAEAIRIKPDKYEAFYNWGIALSIQAKLKGNSPEADALLAEAGHKYAEAVRIKPDKHEAFSNWGIALSIQAKLKGNSPEADALFAEAGRKHAEAIRIKPDKYEAFYNWGIALSSQAHLKGNSPEADALFAEAGRKYAEAVRIKPDKHEAFSNWGIALSNQAKLKGNSPEADALFAEAGRKYAEAVRLQPGSFPYHFNSACLHALLGNGDVAVSHLIAWKDRNPTASRRDLDLDSDFDRIRGSHAFLGFRASLPE